MLSQRRSTDVRVLQAQLDLTSQTIRSTRLTSPFWAVAIAWLASNWSGVFGHVSIKVALFVPVIVSATMILSASVVSIYQYDTSDSSEYERTRPWFSRIVAMQAIISAAWGLAPWLLWDPSSVTNHIYLGGVVTAVLAMLVVSRSSHMDMFIASIVPLTVMSSLRFMFGHNAIDFGIGLAIPAFAAQLMVDGRRLMHRLDEDSRLRFQVEDLARELAETRDDALRKRYDAETKTAATIAALEEERDRRIRAERDAVWKDVAFTAAHKLGNPIFALETNLQALDRRINADELLAITGEMRLSVETSKAIIEQFKSLTKAQEISKQNCDVVQLLERAGHVAHANGVDVQITVPDSGVPPAEIDPIRISECFDELIANSLHWFDKSEKRIFIAVSIASGDCAAAVLLGGAEYIRIEYRDNGCGIPQDKKEQIFAPFYSTFPHGTGLGLSLVRRIIEGHAGLIRECGTEGVGAYFEMFLPQACSE